MFLILAGSAHDVTLCLFIEEQSYVLSKGGFVNGHVFPPWDEPPVQMGSAQSIYRFVVFRPRIFLLSFRFKRSRWATDAITGASQGLGFLATPLPPVKPYARGDSSSRNYPTRRFGLLRMCIDICVFRALAEIWLQSEYSFIHPKR